MAFTGKGLIIGLWTTLKHLFRPAITVQYPVHKIEIPKRMRGRHAILRDDAGNELCIGCKACVRICPDKLITVTTSKAPEGSDKKLIVDGFTLDLEACMFCGLCEDVCPNHGLVMTNFYEMATQNRKEIFLTKEKLIESGKNHELSE